jgi:hypothetical protein
MEGHLEAPLEMNFCSKPPNFEVEAHMEAPAGDALTNVNVCVSTTNNHTSLVWSLHKCTG